MPGAMSAFDRVKQEEGGFLPNIYTDSLGNATVGTGFNLADPSVAAKINPEVVSGKRPMTQEENDAIYQGFFDQAQKDSIEFVGKNVYDYLSDDQKLAILDMTYNMGLPRLKGFKKFRQAIIDGDYAEAAAEIQRGKNPKENSTYFNKNNKRALRNMKLIQSTAKEKDNARP